MPEIKLNNHIIKIERENKIFFPKQKITKGDLIEYYSKVSPFILKYLQDRPMVMQRFPDGINGESFYAKDTPEYFPNWIKTKKIKKKTGGSNNYIICQDEATLIYLANQACITYHMWLSKKNKLNYPDRIVFDLDLAVKDKKNFRLACKTAKLLKNIIESIELTAWVKTTGSSGLHVEIPITIEKNFDYTRAFARKIAETLINQYPEQLTLENRKEKRGNKLLIDIMRNGFGATVVTPYSVRALPGAPVATPLEWKELDNPKLSSQSYNTNNIFRRLKSNGDLWDKMEKNAKSIIKAKKILEEKYL